MAGASLRSARYVARIAKEVPMRRFTLLAAVILVGVGALLSVPGLAGASARGARATTTVTVKASEFKFVLSKKVVAKGTVVFKVTNAGKLAHDFKIAGKKTPLIQPQKA